MGLQQGSVSLCRYRLLGAGRKNRISDLNGLIERYKAKPLTIDGVSKEELIGWVRPLGLDQVELPPDAPWDLSHCQADDDGFVLRLRIERRKVPASLLQLIYKRRFFDHAAKVGKSPGPKERKELREQVKEELMQRALPGVSYVDAYWRDGSGDLTLFTTGKKTRQLFETLFQETFANPLEQTLVRIDPPLMGLSRQEWEDSHIASDTLSRLSLATPVAFAEHIYP